MKLKIGAQLYTIREFTQTAADFAKSMKKIAGIGYKYVQVSAIGPIPAKEVADICASNGLGIVVTHTNPAKIKNDTDSVIEDHRIMGAKYVGIGAMPGNYSRSSEGIKSFINDFALPAKKIEQAGMQLMYHNHDFEWEKFDEKRMIEHLVENFPNLGFILDTYWVQAAGGDPAAWLTKLEGKVPVIHFKDMAWWDGQKRMAEVMEGNLNWPAIFAACATSGVEYAMVEQDDCNGKNPFESLKISYENIMEVL